MSNDLKLKKEYEIKSYEVNAKGELKPHMLLHFFEDAAYESAESLGFGYSEVTKRGLAWFVLKYRIKIEKLPKTWNSVKLTTWPSENKGALCRREFEMQNENNEKIVSASSLWGLIDIEKKRLVNPKKNLPYPDLKEEYALNCDFSSIEIVTKLDKTKEIEIEYNDIDLNGHVNNANYLNWAYGSLDLETIKNKNIKEISIDYKTEAILKEIIEIKTKTENELSYHKITSADKEISNILIKWN